MSVESILNNHYGIKKVFLKNPRITHKYQVASGDKYRIYDYLTVTGRKAYAKLIGLFYDLESILGGCFIAEPWVVKIKKLFGVSDIVTTPTEAQRTCLDSIVMSQFGCKKVFLKKRQICGYFTCGGEPEPDYEYFTRAGGKAYGRLTGLIYDLGPLLGDGFDEHFIVSCLDQIVTEDY